MARCALLVACGASASVCARGGEVTRCRKKDDHVSPTSLPLLPSLSHTQNPFGEAKPREAVLSTRLGKSEEEILRESVKAERPKVRERVVELAAEMCLAGALFLCCSLLLPC